MIDDNNGLGFEASWYVWVLLFVLILLSAGSPDLLDAIVELVRSLAVCR